MEEIKLRAKLPHPLVGDGDFTSANVKRFPKYVKGDDVQAFLFSYERTCKDLNIPEENWMLYLCPQICGTLSEIY